MKEVRKQDSFPTIFVLFLLMFMTICIMVCKYKTDAYTVELESTKIFEERFYRREFSCSGRWRNAIFRQ